MEQLQRYLNHSKIDVVFKQNKDDFVVTEIPLYEFSGEGEHLILKIREAGREAYYISTDGFGKTLIHLSKSAFEGNTIIEKQIQDALDLALNKDLMLD